MSFTTAEEVQFADGFDVPDRLAFGLGSLQLFAVVAGLLAGYGVLHAPLPAMVAIPLALTLAAIGAALGCVRVSGRPAIDWAVFALRFLVAAHTGGALVRTVAAPADGSRAHPGSEALTLPPPPRRPYVLRDQTAATALTQRTVVRRRTAGAHRIAFFSLKGGTGRTTLASELAGRLGGVTAGGVALLDVDLRAASLSARLGLSGPTIVDFASTPADDRRATDHLLAWRSNVRVMLGPSRPPNPEWPVTPAVARELLRDLDMAAFGVVIVDLSPELSPLTEAVLRSVDDVFIVVVPTASGLHDAYRTTEALRRQGLRHQLRYIVNRVRADSDVSEAMRDLDGRVVAEIPEDCAVVDAENDHVLTRDGSPAAQALQRFARCIDKELRWACEE